MLVMIMFVGYLATVMKVFDKHANANFAALITYVTVPSLVIASVEGAGEVGTKSDTLFVLLTATLMYLFTVGLAKFSPKLFRADKETEGIIEFLTIFTNNGFMGLPVVQAIFGTGALFYASLYGIPNNLLEWMPGTTGAIKLQVKTIFLSRRAGGIFVGLTPAGPSNLPVAKPTVGKSMAQVGLSFTPRGKPRTTGAADLVLVAQDKRSLGLVRGSLLVDEATSLKAATTLHHEKNDQEGAYRIIHALAGLLRSNNDADLANERKLIFDLERTLAKLSGHQGEPAPVKAPSVDPVSSLPPRP